MSDESLSVTRHTTRRRTEALTAPLESFYQSFLKCDIRGMAENAVQSSSIIGFACSLLLCCGSLIAAIVLAIIDTVQYNMQKHESSDASTSWNAIEIAMVCTGGTSLLLLYLLFYLIRGVNRIDQGGELSTDTTFNMAFLLCLVTTPILIPYIMLRAGFGCIMGLIDYLPKCCPKEYEISETITLRSDRIDNITPFYQNDSYGTVTKLSSDLGANKQPV